MVASAVVHGTFFGSPSPALGSYFGSPRVALFATLASSFNVIFTHWLVVPLHPDGLAIGLVGRRSWRPPRYTRLAARRWWPPWWSESCSPCAWHGRPVRLAPVVRWSARLQRLWPTPRVARFRRSMIVAAVPAVAVGSSSRISRLPRLSRRDAGDSHQAFRPDPDIEDPLVYMISNRDLGADSRGPCLPWLTDPLLLGALVAGIGGPAAIAPRWSACAISGGSTRDADGPDHSSRVV